MFQQMQTMAQKQVNYLIMTVTIQFVATFRVAFIPSNQENYTKKFPFFNIEKLDVEFFE